ncbi:hypothetical protein [Desertivirga brevis]|uniref:hypothetical protein n=1 Tax=Desertivirga brevis TaxID=2810310 RepID=UPI001A960B2C|nr:hypothetical protein [Pedobacter sp. SYSU D00873]
MTNLQIDHLTQKFYESICFSHEKYPNLDQLQELFYGDGKLVNGNFDNPLEFTVQSYMQAIMHQIEEGNAEFYSIQEIADVTEVFGNTAHRVSVYEHASRPNSEQPWKRGVNYIQFIFNEGSWRIISMLWNDEKEGLKVPEEYFG